MDKVQELFPHLPELQKRTLRYLLEYLNGSLTGDQVADSLCVEFYTELKELQS